MNRLTPRHTPLTTAERLSNELALYHWQFMHIVNSELLSLLATVGNRYAFANNGEVTDKHDRQQMALVIARIFTDDLITPFDMDVIEALAMVRTRGCEVFSKYCTVSWNHLKLLLRLTDIARQEQWLDAIIHSGISVVQLKELLATQASPAVLTSRAKQRTQVQPLEVTAQRTINYSVLPNFFIGPQWNNLQQLLSFKAIESNALQFLEEANQQRIVNISNDVVSFTETVSRRLNTRWNFNIWEIGTAIRSAVTDSPDPALLHAIALALTQRFGSQFDESYLNDTVIFARNCQDAETRCRICSALQWDAIRQLLSLFTEDEQLLYTKLLATNPVPNAEIKAFIAHYASAHQDALETKREHSNVPVKKTTIVTNTRGNNIVKITTHIVTLEDEFAHSKAVPIINHNIGLLAFLQSVSW